MKTVSHSPTTMPAGRPAQLPPEDRRRILADRVADVLFGLIGLGYFCHALKILAARLDASAIWDDGFMFVRYADNILTSVRVSWNPHGPPTYGLTSLLYMAVVLPMTALLRHSPARAIECSSLLCGALFALLFTALVLRSSSAAGRARTVIALIVLLPVVAHFRSLSTHFLSGMDTMFVLAYLCAYFLAFRRYERSPSRSGAAAVVLLGGLAFSARPDLLLYTMALPAALFVFAPERRRQAGVILLTSAGLVLAQMAVYALYFHSPLPLPFYVKGFHHYKGFTYQLYRVVAAEQFGQYVREYWPLLAMIALGLWGRIRDWSPMNKGLLLATLAWLVYFRFFVVQIMPFDERFFFPTLPALGVLAAFSLGRLLERAGPVWDDRPLLRRGALVAGAALALALVPSVLLAPYAGRLLVGKLHAPRFSAGSLYDTQKQSVWFALDPISRLPDGLTVATTEVGLPGVILPGKKIVDMAGLHETRFAHGPFQAQWMFDHYHPDLIYVPYPAYKQFNDDLDGSAYYRAHYEVYPAASLHALMGVALWKDSPYYARMRDIVRRQPVPPPVVPVPDTSISLSLVLSRLRAHLR